MDQRFVSLFSVYNMAFPTKEVLEHIYTSILAAHMETFTEAVKDNITPIVEASLELFGVGKKEI